MAKMYNLIGTTRGKDGVVTVRGAATESRIKDMTKAGLTEIVLVELPVTMNKLHGAKFIQNLPEYQSAEQQAAIAKYISLNDDGTMVVFEYETTAEEGSVDAGVASTELEVA